MKLKHTPGLWKLDTSVDVAGVLQSVDGGYIPILTPWRRSPTFNETDETKANMKLIAAAPEMLTALIDSFKILYEQWDNGLLNKYCDEVLIDNMQYIIEKATGQTIEEVLDDI